VRRSLKSRKIHENPIFSDALGEVQGRSRSSIDVGTPESSSAVLAMISTTNLCPSATVLTLDELINSRKITTFSGGTSL